MRQVFELQKGDRFQFQYDSNTVYEALGYKNEDSEAVRRVAFKSNDNEWHTAPDSHEENCNPYADVILVKLELTVTPITTLAHLSS